MEEGIYNKVVKERFERLKDILWDSLKNKEKLETLSPVIRDSFGKVKNLEESATLSILIDHFAYHLSFEDMKTQNDIRELAHNYWKSLDDLKKPSCPNSDDLFKLENLCRVSFIDGYGKGNEWKKG